MIKRGITLGEYDTAAKGWTLCEYHLEGAEQQTNFIDIPGGVPLDASTALTDGEPSYYSRLLTARLERSDGTRQAREAQIRDMINALDGYRLDIITPDDPEHYIPGRISVKKDYNDLAHASVSISATCDPWGRHTVNSGEWVDVNTSAEGVITNIRYSKDTVSVSYPNNLFVTDPVANLTVNAAGGAIVAPFTSYSTAEAVGSVLCRLAGGSDIKDVVLSIYAIGKWKEEE